MDMTLIEKLQS